MAEEFSYKVTGESIIILKKRLPFKLISNIFLKVEGTAPMGGISGCVTSDDGNRWIIGKVLQDDSFEDHYYQEDPVFFKSLIDKLLFPE